MAKSNKGKRGGKSAPKASQTPSDATTAQLEAALAAGEVPMLVDVRSAMEFGGGHVPQAVNIPLGSLASRMGELPDTVWVMCASGNRSVTAASSIRKSGKTAVNVTGGMRAWRGAVDPAASPRRLLLPGLAVLTLGLAPFAPEPHLVGKLRWVAGGGVGMAPGDWFDLAMHGAPWLWLGWSLFTLARDARAAR
ncbi:MAG: rhodanese-related sulfurtransferase [Myxococcota bacterium]|jgi:rhodanese-related sulfurtransferase